MQINSSWSVRLGVGVIAGASVLACQREGADLPDTALDANTYDARFEYPDSAILMRDGGGWDGGPSSGLQCESCETDTDCQAGAQCAQLGGTAVLHTWTRELELHPHLHCIVTGGGLAPDHERWIRARTKHLLPVRVLSDVFRGKFMSALRREQARGSFASFDAFDDPEGF